MAGNERLIRQAIHATIRQLAAMCATGLTG
jgi:hypothetical protein